MKTIYKYPLPLDRIQSVSMPADALIRSVGKQGDDLMLWAEVDTNAPHKTRTIEIFGTGHSIPEDMGASRAYIGTVQAGFFVWHIYERKSLALLDGKNTEIKT